MEKVFIFFISSKKLTKSLLELIFLNKATLIIVEDPEDLLDLAATLFRHPTDLKEFFGTKGIWS